MTISGQGKAELPRDKGKRKEPSLNQAPEKEKKTKEGEPKKDKKKEGQ